MRDIEDLLSDFDNITNTTALRFDALKEIRKLRTERDEARAALKPFAEKYLYPDDGGVGYAAELRAEPDWDEARNDEQVDDLWIKRGLIRAARKALGEAK